MFLELLCCVGYMVWLVITVMALSPVIILVSTRLYYIKFFFFVNSFSLMADNGTERDPTQYDPRWQAIEEVHFNWRCIVCGLVALSPGHLEHQHIPGTESLYYDLDNTPWVKCDKCHTPFHLQCATWEPENVVRNKRFLCTFFLCRQF